MISIYGPMFLMLLTAAGLAFVFWGTATFLGRHKKPNAE